MIAVDSNTVDIEQLLDKVESRARNLMPVWDEVGAWFSSRQKTIFATQNYGTWAPLSPRTKSKGVLVRSGKLRREATKATPIMASPTSAIFGVKIGGPGYYGLFHAEGSGVPVRPPVPTLRGSESAEIVDVLTKYLTKEL